jgi:hypothetical protein
MSDDPAFGQRQWISSGFTWLEENWAEDQLWRDVRPHFLDFMGVSDDDLANAPTCRVLGLLVQQTDVLMDPEEQRTGWLSPTDRDGHLENAILQWQRESPAGPGDEAAAPGQDTAHQPAAAEVEPQYFEGHGWMRVDPATNQWVPAEVPADGAAPADAPAAEPAPVPPAAPSEPQWFEGHGWMRVDPATNQWVAAEAPPEPAPVEVGASDPQLAAAVAELPQETQELFTEAVQEELAPIIEEAIGSIEGLEGLSPEDIEAAFAAAVAEAGLAGAAETN